MTRPRAQAPRRRAKSLRTEAEPGCVVDVLERRDVGRPLLRYGQELLVPAEEVFRGNPESR